MNTLADRNPKTAESTKSSSTRDGWSLSYYHLKVIFSTYSNSFPQLRVIQGGSSGCIPYVTVSVLVIFADFQPTDKPL